VNPAGTSLSLFCGALKRAASVPAILRARGGKAPGSAVLGRVRWDLMPEAGGRRGLSGDADGAGDGVREARR
jgi:hypothetical protein